MALVILVTLAAQRLIAAAQPDFIALCVATVVVAATLTLLGWWRLPSNTPWWWEWKAVRVEVVS